MKGKRSLLVLIVLATCLALTLSSTGCGNTGQKAKSILAKADEAIKKVAAENLTWHYESKRVMTMDVEGSSGTNTYVAEADVEPPKKARMVMEMSATGDLTSQLPYMGRVTNEAGEDAYGQEAISVDGGETFYVRILQEDGGYSDWTETEQEAFVIFAEGWDLSNLVSDLSEIMESMEVTGTEEVNGVKCDVIKATTSLGKLIEARKEALGGLANIDLEMLAEYTKDVRPEIYIWIGVEDSLPYKAQIKLTITIMGQSISLDGIEYVSDYGKEISPPIKAPI